MTTETSQGMEIGAQLVELCKQGKGMEAIETLYHDDIVSVEAMAMPDGSREMKGREAIIGKNNWWYENNEVHSMEVAGPFPHGDRFIVNFHMDVTPKGGERMQMNEMGLYTVENGKIVREEFFYGM